MNTVKVKVRFLGVMSKGSGTGEVVMEVQNDFGIAVDAVKDEIIKSIGKDVLYNILINGVNYALIDKSRVITVKDGDEFTVVPVILGG